MAEEQRCHQIESHGGLCANNCGFFGSPATRNLCSKCYRDLRLKEEQESAVKMAVERSLRQTSASAAAAATSSGGVSASPSEAGGEDGGRSRAAGRCLACRRRVGLTGFLCRCGGTFCGAHRYPEKHACGFDFRAAGREEIARANPVVKADKLEKI